MRGIPYGNMMGEIVGLFAQHTPGVTAEVTSHGVYKGIDGVRRFYTGLFANIKHWPAGPSATATELKKREKRLGRLVVHMPTTPVIEVAEDGKTAKAVWLVFHLGADRDEKENVQAYWEFSKLSMDLVKEDGKWKIWHYFAPILFQTKYEQGWVKDSGAEIYAGHSRWARELEKEFPPDAPSTYHKMYDPNGIVEMVPAPPEPYETFDMNDPDEA